jgi:hypothetical protein
VIGTSAADPRVARRPAPFATPGSRCTRSTTATPLLSTSAMVAPAARNIRTISIWSSPAPAVPLAPVGATARCSAVEPAFLVAVHGPAPTDSSAATAARASRADRAVQGRYPAAVRPVNLRSVGGQLLDDPPLAGRVPRGRRRPGIAGVVQAVAPRRLTLLTGAPAASSARAASYRSPAAARCKACRPGRACAAAPQRRCRLPYAVRPRPAFWPRLPRSRTGRLRVLPQRWAPRIQHAPTWLAHVITRPRWSGRSRRGKPPVRWGRDACVRTAHERAAQARS